METEIRTIIAKQLARPLEEILAETRLNELGADSLDQVEIMMTIEDTYNIKMADDFKPETIGQVIEYVRANYKPEVPQQPQSGGAAYQHGTPQ